MQKHVHRVGNLLVGTLAMSMLAGCSAEVVEVEDDLASIEQPFGVSSCSTADADAVFSGEIPWTTTWRSYNTCYRGYVIDLYNASSLSDHEVRFDWADTVPTTQSACEASWARVIVYNRTDGYWVERQTIDEYGWWNPAAGTCVPPSILSGYLSPGKYYRFAVTMRSSYGSAYTRKFRYSSGSRPG